MNYFEAQAAIDDKDYLSADFYRVMQHNSIALGLRDKPVQILFDVAAHGSSHSKELLAQAIEEGWVAKYTEDGMDVYDIEGKGGHGVPYQYRSHLAMQIAFPERYRAFFGGENVWKYDDPRMHELLELCMSCLTNTKHPSDFWGEHALPEDTPKKRGRPKKEGLPTVATGTKSSAHKKWIEACRERKEAIKQAWNAYLETCKRRKISMQQWEDWKKAELAAVEQRIKEINGSYDDAVRHWKGEIEDMRNKHANLKNTPAPTLDDFI